MAAELWTPLDERTDFPLPLVPSGNETGHRGFDRHHPFHPNRHPDLMDVGGRALRECRVQRTPYDLHHNLYHEAFIGPQLPEEETGKFRLVVLAAAGYVPDRGISFEADGSPKVIPISQEFRDNLWSSKSVKVNNQKKVRDFLKQYVIEQDISHVKETLVEEFLLTGDQLRRRELGNTLLSLAVDKATASIWDTYREARTAQLLPPGRAKIASRFVLGSLGMKRHRDLLHDELERKLVA